MTFLTVTGHHRAPIVYFFRIQIGSRTPSGMRLGSGSRPRRMRPYLELPRELWIEIFDKSWSRAMERKGPCLYVCTDGSARACGVGDNPCLVPTLCDPGETSGPRIDRIPSTHPPWWRRQYRELKKLIFLAPSKCSIDLFGPVANRTMLKQMHVVRLLVSLHAASSIWLPAARADRAQNKQPYVTERRPAVPLQQC